MATETNSDNSRYNLHGFRSHDPEPTKYLQVNGGTQIPRSDLDGISLGIDRKPSVVKVVDMSKDEMPTFTMDFGNLPQNVVSSAINEAGGVANTLEVLTKVAEKQRKPATISAKPNPTAQPRYAPAPPAAEPAPQVIQVASPQPQPMYDPMYMMAMQQRMMEEAIAKMKADLMGSPSVSMVAPPPTPSGLVYTAVSDVQGTPDVGEAIDSFLQEIGLDYLKYKPSRPKIPVYFDIAGWGGTLNAFYHGVTQSGPYITLIYDNRWEGDTRCLPPTSDDKRPPLKISVPSLGLDNVTVYSLGMNSVEGPFDRCTLIIHEPVDEE